ncbi:MAG: FAD-dependent monooxygenase [Rhodobacteraceae bacterium]|nr:FAD-dependent monooxygenase [Paracoccaceae bacterium]
MVLPGEEGAELLSDAGLARLLAPFRPFRPQEVLRRAVYTFHARIACEWRRERVFLMGDAAHLTPPFAGQGMNAGLRDAHNLAWKIALVEQGHAAPGILDTYAEERREPARAMIRLAVAMGRIVMPASPGEAAFRAALVAALEPFPGVRDWLVAMRFKPPPAYASGLFLDRDSQPFEASLVGRMAPQPDLEGPAGTGPLDAALGPGFALVAQDGPGRRQSAGPGLADPSRPVFLLRPERYVAAAFDPGALEDGGARLAGLLGMAARLSAPVPPGA